MPVYLPTPPPSLPEGENPPDDLTLTASQTEMQEKVCEHFSKEDYEIPGQEQGLLMDDEKFWLSFECMLRFLRGTKWDVDVAIQRLEETLKWRRDFGIYDRVKASHVEPEAVTGKEIVFGYDIERRPAFYMIPSRQNTTEATRQIEFAVWMLERTIDLMGPGVETISLLINFADRAKNPSFGTARTVLHILQSHYPERLGLALVINVPFLINAFFRLIMPFVDPVTRPKLRFNPDVVRDGIFAPDSVMKDWWGGTCDFVYDHDKYWPALVEMCEEKRRTEMERWRGLGGTVGLKEWDFKQCTASLPFASDATDGGVSGVGVVPASFQTAEVAA